jgi:hypothetical protein
MPPADGRPLSIKTKIDASKTLGKHMPIPTHREHMKQPMSETSHTHRDFFGFVAPPSFGRTPAFIHKKCYNYLQRGHLTCQYPVTLNCLGNPTLAETNKTTLEDESTM